MMIAPKKNSRPIQSQKPILCRWRLSALVAAVVSLLVLIYLAISGDADDDRAEVEVTVKQERHRRHVADSLVDKTCQTVAQTVDDAVEEVASIVEPQTNQWGNPAHWGHKKLRPSKVHRINRSQMPLFERVFDNSVNKTIAGLLVIEPGTDLIGEEIYDNDFVKRFLRSIANPIIVSREDDDETKALKRAVIETKIELKERYDRGEDIAQILTDIRRELRELGAYREDIRKLIEEYSHNHNLAEADMKDYVSAANVLLEERGAKPIIMPEFYYKQLEIRNQKIRALKGEKP